MHSIEITKETCTIVQDGVKVASVPLVDLVAAIQAQAEQTPPLDLIPDGVRFLRRRGDAVAVVTEVMPVARTVQWLADNSPVPFGPKAVYRTVRLSFPYVVLVIVFQRGALTGYQQCFYRNAPLSSLSDPLFLPNLYNVAERSGQACWLCLAKLTPSVARLGWGRKLAEIHDHLWGGSWNRSSEVHEGNSFWSRPAVDRRVSSIEAWEKHSAADPRFAVTLPWKPANTTVEKVMSQMLDAVAPLRTPKTADAVAALLLNAAPAGAGGAAGTAPTLAGILGLLK